MASRRIIGRAVVALAIVTCATPALAQVSSVNLNFNGGGGGLLDTGFENAYGLNTGGFSLNFSNNGLLSIATLDGDTFGNYENDPDTAQNMFYQSMDVGARTVLQAKVNAINLNQDYHGGGIWMGTDQDHYVRLGLIHNSNVDANGSALEALRENEDRWPGNGPDFPNRPGADIESRYTDISANAVPSSTSNPGASDVNNAILRLVRDHNAVACYVSFDNGVTFSRAGGDTYSFNSLATDGTSLPIDNRTVADPNNTDLSSHTVEGGFKVGAYAVGGGGSQAVIQFDSLTAITGTPTWTAAGNGDWTTDANWSNNNGLGAPTNIESTAVFPTEAAARTINVPSAITATNVTFGSANGYTVSGTGAITFDWFYFPTHPTYYTNGPGTVAVTAGNVTISAPTTVAHKHDFNISAGATLTLSAFGASPVANTDAGVRKLGAGTMKVNALHTFNIDVQAGSLQIMPNGTAANLSTVSTINVVTTAGSTANLDLTNNGLVVDYDPSIGTSPLAAVSALVKSGRGTTGAYNGPGITSSTAAANARFGVGIAEASSLTTIPAFFGTPDATALLLRYTYVGDANLNGQVTFDDLLALAKNYNGTGKTWVQGDFDYSGTVDFADLLGLAKNYNATPLSASEAAAVGSGFAADFALAQSLAPEPATLLAGLGLTTLIARRRRAR